MFGWYSERFVFIKKGSVFFILQEEVENCQVSKGNWFLCQGWYNFNEKLNIWRYYVIENRNYESNVDLNKFCVKHNIDFTDSVWNLTLTQADSAWNGIKIRNV